MIAHRFQGLLARRAVTRTFTFALTLMVFASSASSASAAPVPQDPDFTVSRIDMVQVIPSVALVTLKPIFVRAHVTYTGTLPPGTVVDGVMRVYDGGVEEPYSPVYSDNGPFTPPATIGLGMEDATLNFVFVPPTSSGLQVIVEINPAGAGQVPESNFANNVVANAIRQVFCSRRPEIAYVPIDYRPSGGGANLPNPAFIEPGVGDNFVQAIFPTADWNYHRSDVPSKLWTSSLSGTGSALLNSLAVDRNLMSPIPDFIYGWVPGSLPYNGQANGIPGTAGMGNTQTIRHQRTFAHELGHLMGRVHINNTTGRPGVDVERHLNITQSLPLIKRSSLFDIMVAGLLTNQAWIYQPNFDAIRARNTFNCGDLRVARQPGNSLLVAGLWDRDAGTVELTDTLTFPGGTPSETVSLDAANLIVRIRTTAGLVAEYGLTANSSTDSCAAPAAEIDAGKDPASASDSTEGEVALAPFIAVLPNNVAPSSIVRLDILDGVTRRELATISRSDSAPAVRLTSPRFRSVQGGEIRIEWEADDADGDQVKHYLRYSPDGDRMVPIASNTELTSFTLDLTSLPELESDRGYFEILSSDGLNTTRTWTGTMGNSAQARGAAVNAPWTYILTPDAGMSYPERGTVVLHSSGWDLEDRSIGGASIQWTSNIDGAIGQGRVTSISTLSVGAHIITVTATDSDGMMSTDTVAITITDRDVPLEASIASRNAGPNADSYTASNPVLGSTWTADVDLNTTGHTMAQVIGHAAPGNNVLNGGQVFLLSGPLVFSLPLQAGPIASWTAPIPTDPSLAGLSLYTQAIHIFGVTPFALSNALDMLVGY